LRSANKFDEDDAPVNFVLPPYPHKDLLILGHPFTGSYPPSQPTGMSTKIGADAAITMQFSTEILNLNSK
jgi:hypothetical protein